MLRRSWIRLALILVVAGVLWWRERDTTPSGSSVPGSPEAPSSTLAAGSELETLFESRESGRVVEFEGTVERILPDDQEGSRHQRFIVRASSDLTVLIAHNIDLAPRVPLERGDRVRIRGQYEWNERGGVIHWTHHDPGGRREGGWIRRGGRIFQ